MLKLALLLVFLLLPDGRRVAWAALKSVLAVWRPGAGLAAVLALMAAAVLALREDWLAAAVLAGVGAALALAARRRPAPPLRTAPADAGMSAAEARAILGVAEGAAPEAIEAAYRRLIRMAHPDQGGTAGLAAQLNAARAILVPR